MKKIKFSWQTRLILVLLLLSILLYFIHYWIFHDAHHIFVYLLGDIAFLPVEALLVVLVLHKILNNREKKQKLKKMNMVIGAMYSEVGFTLIGLIKDFSLDHKKLSQELGSLKDFSNLDFRQKQLFLKTFSFETNSRNGSLDELKTFLLARRDFLLRLLENPNLLEHDSFTDLLWAVFHLTDELMMRKSLSRLGENDYNHLSSDITRAYSLLVREWLAYMAHLKQDYPYLFSLAQRASPFASKVQVEIV